MDPEKDLKKENVRVNEENFGRCGLSCSFWPMITVVVIVGFAIAFGMKACSSADDSAEVVEITETTSASSSPQF